MGKILFVGENPQHYSGNAHMLRALLCQLDTSKHQFAVFASYELQPWDRDLFSPLPFTLIPATDHSDPWGGNKLATLVENAKFDALVMVGLDIWRYASVYDRLEKAHRENGFKWVAIFPYDLQTLRKDWVHWINMFDYPCVYSKYGYNLLKDSVPNLQYFRPPLDGYENYKYAEGDTWKYYRRKNYPNLKEDDFLFGFVGANQFRKDPLKVIRAFSKAKREVPNIKLYLHTELRGVFNLYQNMMDLNMTTGDVVVKHQGVHYPEKRMMEMYNCLDCLVNTSMQEGLSWTLLEAMLCGTPIIGTDTTAQTELLQGVGVMLPCVEDAHIPLYSKTGETWVDAKACSEKTLVDAMIHMATAEDEVKESMRLAGFERVQEWLEGVSNINDLLETVLSEVSEESPKPEKIKRILFAQHSAAGDVFMTTRCLKGIKERHPDMPLDYMTEPKYMDIIEGNPYVDKILPWDVAEQYRYFKVYNPHGDRILPGHWGRNCNSILSDFYWKILMVEPDDFFIERERPSDDLAEYIQGQEEMGPIAVVHTTGGDADFRTYKYMPDVVEWLKSKGYFTVQLGGPDDFPADAELDLRGKLSFRATAWVMDKASVAVTVDSFMSHLAGALGVSQVCLFGSGNYVVTRPNQVKGKLICMTPDYVMDCKGLGPCSAQVRDCPTPCTGVHDPKDIIKAIQLLGAQGWIRRNYDNQETDHIVQYA